MTKPTKWVCSQWVPNKPSFLHADNEDSDQTRRMPRLIWVFAGRTWHFVGFVIWRLILSSLVQDCVKIQSSELGIGVCWKLLRVALLKNKRPTNNNNNKILCWLKRHRILIMCQSYIYMRQNSLQVQRLPKFVRRSRISDLICACKQHD